MDDRVSALLSVYALIALATFLLTALYVAVLDALAERSGRGWGKNGEYSRRYDISTVCGVSGEVLRVERFAPRHGVSRGVYLVVRHSGGDLLVSLGPAWFVDAQEETFAVGDRIEVIGSKIDCYGKEVLVAAEVTEGGRSRTLREPGGRPVWTGDSAASDRDDRDAAKRRRSVSAPPLYQTDLDRHLWSWEGHRARA